MERTVLSEYISLKFETQTEYSHWFGYYNYCPLSTNGELLLAHRVNFEGRDPEPDDYAEIGYFNIHTSEWKIIDRTNAFNWQQGAMLQWLNNDEVIYNIKDGQHYAAKIYNLKNNKSRKINWPIYGVTSDGKWSVSLNFERSYWCRAYHYEPIKNEKYNVNIALEEGIFLIDLEKNLYKKIISIQDIIKIDPLPDFQDRKHWLEHIMINQNGSRFAFYHRYSTKEGFWTRVFTANLDGSDLYLFSDWKKNEYTHMNWRNKNEFFIFARHIQPTGKIYTKATENTGAFGDSIKKIYRITIRKFIHRYMKNQLISNKRYLVVQENQGVLKILKHQKLYTDGHPSFTNDGKYMLTDTYALEDGFRYLLLYNIEKNRIFELGKFFSPYNECGYRCDLHPRFSKDNNSIIIDSAHTGKHQIYIFKINWNMMNQEIEEYDE